MKNFKNINKIIYRACLFVFAISLTGLMSCNDDEEMMENTPPVANAGPDITVSAEVTVELDASGSADADGDALSYEWSVQSVPDAARFSFSNSSGEQAVFSAATPGEYVIELIVNDGTEPSVPDEVIVTVTAVANAAPTATIVDQNGNAFSEANDNTEISINAGIVLSGAQSSDPENDMLTFSWSVADAPVGSVPAIDDVANESITFTPDLPGAYTIELRVKDSNDNEGIAMVQLTATGNPVIIDSDVITETTWEDIYDDPDLPDYQIVSSIDVNAFLTIEAGVNIIIDEGLIVSVNANGGLDAQGTASDSISITSTDSDAGLKWQGLYVNSSDVRNSLNYVNLSWAGNSGIGFGPLNTRELVGLGVDDNGKMSITNSTFKNNTGYSVYFDDGGGELEDFSNNAFEDYETAIALPANEVDGLDGETTFTNGSVADVRIFPTTYSGNKTSTWPALNNARYFVPGNIRISGQLTIEAGAIFEMDEDVFWSVDGSIDVNGTASDHVIFTSANVAAQINWGGMFIESASALNSFDYAEILFAGGASGGYGPINTPVRAALGVDYLQHKVSLTNSVISGSEGYGLYI
ncbi:MAG: PKD domain-containing protein, partial [Cyclobacteriaceae bacterium]